MKRIAVILLTLFSLAAGCTHREQNVILIGAAGPMTGDQSKMGIDLKNAVQLAVDEWNAAGGVLGKKIELIAGDDQADPKQAVSIANKFINEGVVAVVGHWNSSCSIPASEFYNRAKVVMISPASTNPRLTQQGFRNVFRVCGTDDQQGGVAAEFALQTLKPKRVAVLHDKSTYGQGLADYFKKSVETKTQVVFYDGIIQHDPDYRAILTAMKEKKPDVYFFGGIYPEAARLVRQAREIGLAAPMITGDGVYDPTFIRIAGDAAEGTYVTFGRNTSALASAKDFNAHYKERYGEPGPYSVYAYDAANIILTAIKQTGTTDGARVSDYIAKNSFPGAFGRISFNANGDTAKAPYVVWKVKGGAFVETK